MSKRFYDYDVDFYYEPQDSTPFVEFEELIKTVEEDDLDEFISLTLSNEFEHKKIFRYLLNNDNKQEFLKAAIAIIVHKYIKELDDLFIHGLWDSDKIYLIEELLKGELDKIIINRNRKSFESLSDLIKIGELVIRTNNKEFIKSLIPYFSYKYARFFFINLIKYSTDVELLENFLNSLYERMKKQIDVNDLDEYFKKAICVGNKPFIEYFIKLGCKVKNMDYFSEMINYDKDIIKYLLENGALIYINNGDKKVPDKVLTNIIKTLIC